MRDDLVGYLIGALDAPDAKRVESMLADPREGEQVRRDLELLDRSMVALAADRDPLAVPPGLAARTLQMIATRKGSEVRHPDGDPSRAETASHGHSPGDHRSSPRPGRQNTRHRGGHVVRPATMTPERPSSNVESPIRWIDTLVLAATALAACILVIPGIGRLVDDGRRTQVVRRLGRIGGSLQGYASSHRRYPTPPDGGPLSRGGLYAPTLVSEHRIVSDDGTVLAPGSQLSVSGTYRVPTVEEVKAAVGTPAFDDMVRSMGGDFGYTLGHRDPTGRLMPNRPLFRSHHPIMADAPDESGERSSNHPAGLHHILFEDGRVTTTHETDLHGDDHLFRNHEGRTAAGTDEEDAVIGDSHHQP
jgi:hypothetical protein